MHASRRKSRVLRPHVRWVLFALLCLPPAGILQQAWQDEGGLLALPRWGERFEAKPLQCRHPRM